MIPFPRFAVLQRVVCGVNREARVFGFDYRGGPKVHHSQRASQQGFAGDPSRPRACYRLGVARRGRHLSMPRGQALRRGVRAFGCRCAAETSPGGGPRPARRSPRQWWWPWRPRVSTGVAPGRVHCGTGRPVGPQVGFPSASERQHQPIGAPCPPTGASSA